MTSYTKLLLPLLALLFVAGCGALKDTSVDEIAYPLPAFLFVLVIACACSFYLGSRWLPVPWLRFLLAIFVVYMSTEGLKFFSGFSVTIPPSLEKLSHDGPYSIRVELNDGGEWFRFSAMALIIVLGCLNRNKASDPVDYVLSNKIMKSDVMRIARQRTSAPFLFSFGLWGLARPNKTNFNLAKNNIWFRPFRMIYGFDQLDNIANAFFEEQDRHAEEITEKLVFGMKDKLETESDEDFRKFISMELEKENKKLQAGK